MTNLIPTDADLAVRECLMANQSFALIAGAGSGKTTSLIEALEEIRTQSGSVLRRNGQRVACITYTKRAVEVIRSKLGFDDLYLVSTLHSFVWHEYSRYTSDIREALRLHIIPNMISKAREKDSGKQTKEAQKARNKIAQLEEQLAGLDVVTSFIYDDSTYSDYLKGRIGHDDVIEIAGYLMANKSVFRRLLGYRFPYIFVDEAQDTFGCIVEGLNLTCGGEGLPIVGYFGDDWQQIYEDRAGGIVPPQNGRLITKTENFRCSRSVIDFLNAYRTDLTQIPAGPNRDVQGSVEMMLIRAEDPEEPRKKYSEAQVVRALARMDRALEQWEWHERADIVRLFLARQMIARRLGFPELNKLFKGEFASQSAQDEYDSGEHFLLKPFILTISPLVTAFRDNERRQIVDILRRNSPAFDIRGKNSGRPLSEMIDLSTGILAELARLWENGSVRDILLHCQTHELIKFPDRLTENLARPPRPEEYNEDDHQEDKGDWLSDQFFAMRTGELEPYCNFILKNSAYSTQHGVKGEQYPNVLVVFDDVEAAWSHYSFAKLLTPETAGEPTEGQRERGRKQAYVCFSRAEEHLRIVLYTPNPEAARGELIRRGLLSERQIKILGGP